jgi:hypothetical protein
MKAPSTQLQYVMIYICLLLLAAHVHSTIQLENK